MDEDKIARYNKMLKVFVENGGLIFRNGEQVTVQDIIDIQMVMENREYLPDFFVKDENGEIKEIWFDDSTPDELK